MRRVALVLAVLMGLTLWAPPAQASVRWRALITFDKNPADPFDARLNWDLQHTSSTGWVSVDHAEWRAGSGMGGKRGEDPCANDIGWLPNGYYRVKFHPNYPGHLIKGGVFQLDDKRCRTGNRRFDLFIHTEQGARNTQCPNRRGDQACRWEWPRINDYRSAGCIKMAPGDLASLAKHFTSRYRAGVRYPLALVSLQVVS